MSNLSITRTVPHGVTTPLPGLEHHPSFPGGMPAIIAEPVEHGYCTDCASLAGQIRACERLGDRDGMVAYGRVAIRHCAAAHPDIDSYGIHATGDIGKSQTRHNRCPS